jgi:hypothetical protein
VSITDNKTAEVVASMLVENTGVHMLDSGGAAGRAWQRNQKAVGDMSPAEFFESQPVAWWGWPTVYPHSNFREGKSILDQRAELWTTVSVYHFLTNMVTFNEDIDKAFTEFAELPENKEEYWMGLMEAFPQWYAERQAKIDLADHVNMCDDDCEDDWHSFYDAPRGPFGGSEGHYLFDYSYNHENNLSQDIQYIVWRWRDENYALIQIHNGADARGGLTAPRAFDVFEGEFLDYSRAACGCDNCHTNWYTDGGYGGWQNDDGLPSLSDIPAVEGNRAEAAVRCLRVAGEWHMRQVIIEGPDYASSNTVMCPICGKGELTPYGYTF